MGWALIAGGFVLGQIIFKICTKVSIKFFVPIIGTVTGFCFANTFEVIFIYKFPSSFYSEYLVCIIIFTIIAWRYAYNAFNPMLAYLGGYFVQKGFAIALYGDSIADIK